MSEEVPDALAAGTSGAMGEEGHDSRGGRAEGGADDLSSTGDLIAD